MAVKNATMPPNTPHSRDEWAGPVRSAAPNAARNPSAVMADSRPIASQRRSRQAPRHSWHRLAL
jgi:hypothetical protein